MRQSCAYMRVPLCGFTLIELMVSMAISSVMVILLVSVVTEILSSYTRMNDRIIRRSDGSLVVNLIIQDLEAMTVPRGSDGEGLQITVDTDGVNGQVDDMWLTLITSPFETDPDGFQGAPRAVSYRISYEDPIDGSSSGFEVYSIYRKAASAQETFDDCLLYTSDAADD